jgi:hypothetical protein
VRRQLREPRDLSLAFNARRVVGGQRLHEAGDAVADLKREVRRRRPGERSDVLDGDLAARQPVLSLALAHLEDQGLLWL